MRRKNTICTDIVLCQPKLFCAANAPIILIPICACGEFAESAFLTAALRFLRKHIIQNGKQFYLPITNDKRSNGKVAFSQKGIDVNLRVNIPQLDGL